eukprot:4761883-Amphidinium_carterae.4
MCRKEASTCALSMSEVQVFCLISSKVLFVVGKRERKHVCVQQAAWIGNCFGLGTVLKLRAEKHLLKFENNTQHATAKEVQELMRFFFWPSVANVMRDVGLRHTCNKAVKSRMLRWLRPRRRGYGLLWQVTVGPTFSR